MNHHNNSNERRSKKESAMAPAGSYSHRRWFDRDQYSNCDPDELYFFYDFDSEGGSG